MAASEIKKREKKRNQELQGIKKAKKAAPAVCSDTAGSRKRLLVLKHKSKRSQPVPDSAADMTEAPEGNRNVDVVKKSKKTKPKKEKKAKRVKTSSDTPGGSNSGAVPAKTETTKKKKKKKIKKEELTVHDDARGHRGMAGQEQERRATDVHATPQPKAEPKESINSAVPDSSDDEPAPPVPAARSTPAAAPRRPRAAYAGPPVDIKSEESESESEVCASPPRLQKLKPEKLKLEEPKQETPELTRAREVAVIVAHVSGDLKHDLTNDQRNSLSQLLLRVLASRDKVTSEPAYAHVYGTTGTGKTEVLRSVHKHAAASGAACEIAAFSARAALRLGGCTALGLFGIDPDGNHTGGDISAKLPDLDAVLIDDAHLLKASQLDAMHAQLLERGFRGVVVLAADASQLGPVVGGRDIDHAQQLANSLHSARCWEHFRRGNRLLLAKQVRITDVTLAEAVVQIARGSEGSSSCGALRRRTVLLPRHIFPMTTVHSDCDVRDAQQWACRCSLGQRGPVAGGIVCTKNERVNEHNAAILRQQPGQLRKYEALDCSSTSAGSMRSVPSWSTKQNTSNYSDVLELKLGVPARVTLTVDRSHGVVTDALVWVEELCDNFVVVQLADMPGRHGRVKLHRARFSVYVPEESRRVERLQFLLKLAWAVTAHKAPAFEPARVLVDLRNECWLHGQLAVMLSRVARSEAMRVLVHPHSIQGDCIKTTNVVLHDIIESVEGHVS